MTQRASGGAGLALVLIGLAVSGWTTTIAVAADPDSTRTAPSSAVRAEYEKRKSEATRDAASQTRLALWCESQGLSEEKDKHLARALVADSRYPLARAMMGMTSHDGRWADVSSIPERVRENANLAAKLAEYNAKRDAMTNTVDEHWKLAVWCEAEGLKDEATAHFTNVVKLDPTRESAWKRLGYKKVDGQWVTPKQLDEARTETKTQREADELWVPRFKRWRAMIADPSHRDEAEAEMAHIADPRAIPALWRVLALSNDEPIQQAAIEVLSRLSGPLATQGLMELALGANSGQTRRQAAETLRSRDPREFVPLMIARMIKPIVYSVQRGNGAQTVGSLRVEGKSANYLRNYRAMNLPDTLVALGVRPTDRWAVDDNGQLAVRRTTRIPVPPELVPAGTRAVTEFMANQTNQRRIQYDQRIEESLPFSRIQKEMEKGNAAAMGQLSRDVAFLETRNSQIRESNDRILPLLASFSPQQFGQNPEAWSKWWVEDQAGYSYQAPERPSSTIVQNVSADYSPRAVPDYSSGLEISIRHSCFIAGTLVQTFSGPIAIETVQAGDRVLAQDLTTGDLGYRVVLEPVQNKPAPVFMIWLAGDDAPIGATGIHRFWKAGQGWIMARDLKVGDAIRTLKGVRKVAAIEAGPVQPVFNLVVADRSNFFVGAAGALVHDNSLVEPTVQPFDRP